MFIMLMVAAGLMFALAFYVWSSANEAERVMRDMMAEMRAAEAASFKDEADFHEAVAPDEFYAEEPISASAPGVVGTRVDQAPGKTRKKYHFHVPEEPEAGHATIVHMWVEHVSESSDREGTEGNSPSGSSSG